MVRRRKPINGRRLSEEELLKSFEQGLDTLSRLAKVYDEGYPPIAFAMATEVRKILNENAPAIALRATRTFFSPEKHDTPQTLTSLHLLTSARLNSNPPKLTFVPAFYSSDALQNRALPFKEWWNKDVIYRASAAPPGTPAGLIPINGAPTVPYERREKVTRMGLVNLLRNKLGAHQTAEMPELLDQLNEANNWSSFGVQTPQGLFSTDDGTLSVDVNPIPSMMRQICHELLEAYGRSDPPPHEQHIT